MTMTTLTRRLRNSAILLTTLATLANVASNAGAVGYSWNTASSGTWTNTGNWSPVGEPDDSGDTASLGNQAGAYTATLNAARTIGGLTLSGSDPTLTLSNPLTIQGGTSTISGGTLNGTSGMIWRSGAAINWTGAAPAGTLFFQVPTSHTVSVNNNPGTFALATGQSLRMGDVSDSSTTTATTTFTNAFSNSGEIRLGMATGPDNYGVYTLIMTNGTLTNNVGGNINMLVRSATDAGGPWNTREIRSSLQNDGTISVYAADGLLGGTGRTVTNSATGIIKTDHSSYTLAGRIPKVTISGTSFANNGAIQIGANALAGEGGEVNILSTTANFNSGATVTGPGTLNVGGDTVNFNAGTSVSGLSTLAMGRASATTTVNWNIADMANAVTFRVNQAGDVVFNRTGAWNLPSNQVLWLDAVGGIAESASFSMAQNLNNSGLIRMGRAAPGDNYGQLTLALTGATTFTNNVGGVVDMLPRNSGDSGGPWNQRYIDADVVNNGTINADSSDGRLGASGKTVVNNSVINVDSSLYTGGRKAAMQFFGTSATTTGTINLLGGQLWANLPTFNYNGGSITATAGSEILLGSASIDTNFVFNGGADITGPVTWRMLGGATNTITRTTPWNILAGQALTWTVGAGVGGDYLTVNQDVTNSGLIQAGLPAPGDNHLDHRFIINSANSRLTNNANGTILLYPRSSSNTGDPWSIRRLDAEVINDGLIRVYTHRAQIGKAVAGIDHVNNGQIIFDNSILTGTPRPQMDVIGSSFLNDVNGTIGGNGILTTTALPGGLFSNAGTLSPGLSAGTLQIIGNTNFLAGSELVIEVTGGGAVGGVDYDVLTLTGTVSGLNNVDLVVNVSPLLTNADLKNDILTIMTVSGTNIVSGQFNSVTVEGWYATVTFLPNSVILSNFQSTIPEPSTLSLLGLGVVGMAIRQRRRRQRRAAERE